MAAKASQSPVEAQDENRLSSTCDDETTPQARKGGRGGAISRRRWKIALVLCFAAVIGAVFIGTPELDPPPLLWNDSPSMDTGIYRKTADQAEVGAIVSVEIPEAARLYAESRSIEIAWGSFLKPIAAVGGDHVCVSLEEGLQINGQKIAEVRRSDSAGNVIAVWSHCRKLLENEYFLYAPRVPESYDSRYYGPIREENIKGVYTPLWTW